MSTNCTRCEGTGFLNLHQLPDGFNADATGDVLRWIASNLDHDVQVCDCCGDGEDWYDIPGEHYNTHDPPGLYGPYGGNGGLCRCH